MPDYLWKYFDPESDTVFVNPIPQVEPVIEASPYVTALTSEKTIRSSQRLRLLEHEAARELRYKKDIDMYFKQHTIYRVAKKK